MVVVLDPGWISPGHTCADTKNPGYPATLLPGAGFPGDIEGSRVITDRSSSVHRRTVPATSEATINDSSFAKYPDGLGRIGTLLTRAPVVVLKTHRSPLS